MACVLYDRSSNGTISWPVSFSSSSLSFLLRLCSFLLTVSYPLTQPCNHLLDASDESLFLLLWVSVVIAKVGDPTMSLDNDRVTPPSLFEFTSISSLHVLGKTHLGIAKIEVDGLGMSNVQDSIRFRGKPSYHLYINQSQIV